MEVIKKLRKKQGLSQQEVANFLKIAQVSYGRYELGTSEPNIATLKKLSQLYNCSVDELLGIESPQNQLTRLQQEVLAAIKNLDARTVEKIKAYILGISDIPIEKENKWSS